MTREILHDLLLGVAVIGLAYAVYHHHNVHYGAPAGRTQRQAPRGPMTTEELFAQLTAGTVGYGPGGF